MRHRIGIGVVVAALLLVSGSGGTPARAAVAGATVTLVGEMHLGGAHVALPTAASFGTGPTTLCSAVVADPLPSTTGCGMGFGGSYVGSCFLGAGAGTGSGSFGSMNVGIVVAGTTVLLQGEMGGGSFWGVGTWTPHAGSTSCSWGIVTLSLTAEFVTS